MKDVLIKPPVTILLHLLPKYSIKFQVNFSLPYAKSHGERIWSLFNSFSLLLIKMSGTNHFVASDLEHRLPIAILSGYFALKSMFLFMLDPDNQIPFPLFPKYIGSQFSSKALITPFQDQGERATEKIIYPNLIAVNLCK